MKPHTFLIIGTIHCAAMCRTSLNAVKNVLYLFLTFNYKRKEVACLTLYGPCIMIYLHNENQPDELSFLIYFINYPLRVSNRLTIHVEDNYGNKLRKKVHLVGFIMQVAYVCSSTLYFHTA